MEKLVIFDDIFDTESGGAASLRLSESDSGHMDTFFGLILGYLSKALRFCRQRADPGGHEVASFPSLRN